MLFLVIATATDEYYSGIDCAAVGIRRRHAVELLALRDIFARSKSAGCEVDHLLVEMYSISGFFSESSAATQTSASSSCSVWPRPFARHPPPCCDL